LNGQVPPSANQPEPKTERTRLQDRPNVSVAELAALQRGYVERLGKLIEQLTAVMNRPDPPAAAIGSPAPVHDAARPNVSRGTDDRERFAHLVRTPLTGGDASFRLPTDPVRSTVAKVLGAPRPAFVERGAATNSSYLELVGTKDREIAAAMAYAAERWGNDEIIIHVGGRHTEKIIEQAVAHGLNVANRDSYIQSLVTRERARQADPAVQRRRAGTAAETIAVIERAAPAPQRAR